MNLHFSDLSGKRTFWLTVAITGLVKLWLACFFPITGDEAFFYQWARFPDWGYYDHPPMIGWWLWVLDQVGHTPLWIRSATVALTTVLALGVVFLSKRLLPAEDEPKAWLAGAVYLSMPVSWFAVFVTTDTPLLFFMGLSGLCYVLATRQESARGFFLAGIFLGLAFLSKYFAVLLGLAFALHVLFCGKRFKHLLFVVLGALPFVMVNVAYNATHCWNNIMFNLVNRNEGAQWAWQTVLVYLGMLVYLLTPWVTWSLFKHRRVWWQYKPLVFVFLVPLFVFLLISFKKTIGLHWVLGFLPVAFVLLAVCTPLNVLKRYVGFNVLLSIPHLLLFAVLMHAKADIWPQKSFQEDVLFHREMPAILSELTRDMPANAVLTTLSYSPAALMSYHLGKVVPVFGPGKYHARNDDVFVDWRQMAGKPIRIVSKAKPVDPLVYQAYLSNVRVSQRTVRGVPFYIVDGSNFNYQSFRKGPLQDAYDKYYRIPTVLPVWACPFAEKYGFEMHCKGWNF